MPALGNDCVVHTSGRSSTSYSAIQGPPSMDGRGGGAQAVRRDRRKGLPLPGPQLSKAERHKSQAIYSVLLPPKLLLNFPHPKANRGPTDPEDAASLPTCHKEAYSRYPPHFFRSAGTKGRRKLGSNDTDKRHLYFHTYPQLLSNDTTASHTTRF